jgi:hypothetical protein
MLHKNVVDAVFSWASRYTLNVLNLFACIKNIYIRRLLIEIGDASRIYARKFFLCLFFFHFIFILNIYMKRVSYYL